MHIEIPIQLDINAVLQRLRALDSTLADAKLNKHDRAQTLINACISEGIHTGSNIVAAIVSLGFDRKHVGIMLKDGLRHQPEWPYWCRNDDGTYYAPPPRD